MIVEYKERNAKIKFNDFYTLQKRVKKKFSVLLDDLRLEYRDSWSNKWLSIFNDHDLEDIAEQTEGRIIPKKGGEKIYMT